ncbi:MAG: YidC/Oxa1 family membrane protein insertase [Gemmatimonadota bacterium]
MSDFMRSVLFATAHWCGGSLGAAIFVVSFGLRLVMLPLALHMARTGRRQAAILKAISGRLEGLKTLHASDPAALWQATRAVHREAGYQPFSIVGLLGILVQWPFMAALFSAVRKGLGARVRYLWVTDIAQPDRWLITAVTLLAGAATAAMVPAGTPRGSGQTMVALTSVMTFGFLWFASGAIAISYGAGSVVGILQGWLVRREVRREALADG